MSKWRERLERMKTCEYWVIAYRKRNAGANLLQEDRIEGFRLLPQKKFITQADPFLYTHQGKTWLFYEKQNLTDMKGVLWCRNLDEPQAKPVKVLEEPFHLSYPQIFRYGRYTYMLPETRNAGEIRLYRCEQFPGRWEKVETLAEISAVDTTILEDNDCYYLFTYTDNCLEIYLCEPEPERFRPVKKEKIYRSKPSKTTRPGGAFIKEDGRLFRPAQNCTDYYGQELIVNEIVRLRGEAQCQTEGGGLDADCFEEREYCRLSPQNVELPGVNAVGIHTYNRNEMYETIDILHREVGFRTILKKIGWKLRK